MSLIGFEQVMTTLGVWGGGTPFIDPMQIHSLVWITLVPLALLVSVAYKSVRVGEAAPRALVIQSAKMGAQILAGMLVLGVVIHIFLTFVVPFFRG